MQLIIEYEGKTHTFNVPFKIKGRISDLEFLTKTLHGFLLGCALGNASLPDYQLGEVTIHEPTTSDLPEQNYFHGDGLYHPPRNR